MADVERVKQGLKAHTDECAWVCNENCPYYEPSEYGCCDKLTADALSAIDGLQAELAELKERRWIPVSERLPEEEGGYIAYYSYPDGTGYKFVGPCHYSIIGFDEKWSWTNAYGFELSVSHWMPLPEPPQMD